MKFRLLKKEILQAGRTYRAVTQGTYHIHPTGDWSTGGCIIVFALWVIKWFWKHKLLTSSTTIWRQHVFKIQTLGIAPKQLVWLAINWDNLGKPSSIQGNNLTGRWGGSRSMLISVPGPLLATTWSHCSPLSQPSPLASLSLTICSSWTWAKSVRNVSNKIPRMQYSLHSTHSYS